MGSAISRMAPRGRDKIDRILTALALGINIMLIVVHGIAQKTIERGLSPPQDVESTVNLAAIAVAALTAAAIAWRMTLYAYDYIKSGSNTTTTSTPASLEEGNTESPTMDTPPFGPWRVARSISDSSFSVSSTTERFRRMRI